MKKEIIMAVCMGWAFFFGRVSVSSATLIGLDHNLVFNDATNQVWYNDANALYGTWDVSTTLLGSLPGFSEINGVSVSLNWTVASLEEVRTLDFSTRDTRECFVPLTHRSGITGSPWGNQQAEVWWYYGRVADTGWPGSHRVAYYNVVDYENAGTFVNLKDITDTYFIDDLDRYPMWAVANIVPVPEPSTLVLLSGGILVLMAFAMKKEGLCHSCGSYTIDNGRLF